MAVVVTPLTADRSTSGDLVEFTCTSCGESIAGRDAAGSLVRLVAAVFEVLHGEDCERQADAAEDLAVARA